MLPLKMFLHDRRYAPDNYGCVRYVLIHAHVPCTYLPDAVNHVLSLDDLAEYSIAIAGRCAASVVKKSIVSHVDEELRSG